MSIQDLKSDSYAMRRLTNILEMTQSNHDSEALIALRKAQAILKQYNCNYTDLIASPINQGNSKNSARIERLQRLIAMQQKEIHSLEQQLNKSSTRTAKKHNFLGPLTALKGYLMDNFLLKNYEKKLLDKIQTVEPDTKEAYLLLICARRYGVDVEVR